MSCTNNIVIIGNTSLATLYATNLVNHSGNGNHPCITILSTGNDQTTDVYVENLDYAQRNTSLILKALNSERLHNIVTSTKFGSNSFSNEIGSGNTLFEEFYQYYSGAGPLGDSIAAYYQPLIGPWFTTASQNLIRQFVSNYTTDFPLSTNETIVKNNIVNSLGLAETTSVIATKPSVLIKNNILVINNRNLERQLFKDKYIDLITNVNSNSTVINVTHVNNIFLQATNLQDYYNVTYSTIKEPITIQIPNAFVIWADNLYNYAKITGISEAITKPLRIPVSYRIVYPINKNIPATGINLSDIGANGPDLGDGLTTRLTFTCANVGSASLQTAWNVTCYTTDTDLYNISPGNLFINPCEPGSDCCTADQTLLVVEAMSLQNKRDFGWDSLNLSVSIDLNSDDTEAKFYEEFLNIFTIIYIAYTAGIPERPLTVSRSCNTDNMCIYTFPLEQTVFRETPQILVTRLISDLFGNGTYPNPNNSSAINQLL